jgi:2'-5' RNA ligase
VARNRRSDRGGGAPGAARARLFVALDLPDEVRARLAEWREGVLGGRAELRLVAPEALHVTLAFLGARPESEIEALGEAVERSVAGLRAAELRPAGVVALPPRRPRLFALDLVDEGGRAGAVQAAVAGALEALGAYRPEARPFWPHVTLARVRHGERAAVGEGNPPFSGAFGAGDVTLYRSRLSPRGARYEPLVRTRLVT